MRKLRLAEDNLFAKAVKQVNHRIVKTLSAFQTNSSMPPHSHNQKKAYVVVQGIKVVWLKTKN